MRAIDLLQCRHPLLIRLSLQVPDECVVVHDGCLLIFDTEEDADPVAAARPASS